MRSLLLVAGVVAAVGLAREATRSAGSSVRVGRRKRKGCEERYIGTADTLWPEGREEWDLTDPDFYERMEAAFLGTAPCLDLIIDAEEIASGGSVQIGKGYANVHFSRYWGPVEELISEDISETKFDSALSRVKSWLSSHGMDTDEVYYEKDETIREMPDFAAVSQAIVAIEIELNRESSDAWAEMHRFTTKRVSFRDPGKE